MGAEPASLGDWIRTYGGMGLPHALTFSGLFQTGYKTYFGQYDESRRIGYEFAQAMRRDCFLMALVDERKENVGALNWHLEVEDANDPLQREVRDHLDATIRSIFDHRRMFWELLDALWYGRAAVQFKWDWIYRSGIKTLTVREFEPVNGDSLRFQFDGTPYVTVYAGREIPGAAELVSTPLGGRGVVLRGSWRQRFCIHKHEVFAGDFLDIEKAEAIHGLGIRDYVAWTVFMHQEWLAKVSDFLDRVGLGITIFYYEEGNAAAQAEAEKAAAQQSGKVHITMPMAKGGRKITGVERVEVPTSGAEILLKMVEHLELKLERYVVGQDSSSRSSGGDGLGNEASAEFKQSTQEKRTARDADRLEESLTGNCYHPGLIWMMQRWTFPTTVPEQGGFRVRFKFDVTTTASEKRLSGAKTAWEMGATIKEAEVLEFAGLSQPTDNDKVLKGKEQAPPTPPGMGGPGANGNGPPGSGAAQPPGKNGAAKDEESFDGPLKFYRGADWAELAGATICYTKDAQGHEYRRRVTYAAHDVTGEARDESGKWTAGGGSTAKRQPKEGLAKEYTNSINQHWQQLQPLRDRQNRTRDRDEYDRLKGQIGKLDEDHARHKKEFYDNLDAPEAKRNTRVENADAYKQIEPGKFLRRGGLNVVDEDAVREALGGYIPGYDSEEDRREWEGTRHDLTEQVQDEWSDDKAAQKEVIRRHGGGMGADSKTEGLFRVLTTPEEVFPIHQGVGEEYQPVVKAINERWGIAAEKLQAGEAPEYRVVDLEKLRAKREKATRKHAEAHHFAVHYAAGQWITIGGVKGEDGKRHGGSPVYIENGRITKGAPALQGKKIDALKEQAEGDSVRTAKKREKDYQRSKVAKEAKKEGIDPKQLHQLAAEIVAHDAEFVKDRVQMLQETRKMLGEFSGAAKLIHTEQYEDSASVPGLDEAADYWEKRRPDLLRTRPGEGGGPMDALFDLLKQGNPQPMSEADAYEQALEQLRAYKNAPEPTTNETASGAFPDDDFVPFGSQAEALQYAKFGHTLHAPAGGIDIGGKHFTGGEFIPNEDLARATPAEKKKLLKVKKDQPGQKGLFDPEEKKEEPKIEEKPANKVVSKEWAKEQIVAGRPLPPSVLRLYPDLAELMPKESPRATIQDVTPPGFGPGPETEESESVYPSERHQTTQEQELRKSISEAKTLLRGDVGGDKRKAIEESLAKNENRLSLLSIGIGDLERVAGFAVRRINKDEYRIEKESGVGVVKGTAKEIGAYIASETKHQQAYGKQLPEALARAAEWSEPSFMDAQGMARADAAFRKLPQGTPVVSLDEDAGTKGRTGRIVKDEMGRNRVKLDGEDGFASGFVEPLDKELSWRRSDEEMAREQAEKEAAKPKQEELFGGAKEGKVTVPASHTAGSFEAELTDEGDGKIGLQQAGSKLGPAVVFKDKEQSQRFLNDLAGKVEGHANASDQSINRVLSQDAVFLGRGNDGLAFDTGDGNVVKVSSEVPFHWNNGLRSAEDGRNRLREQVKVNDLLLAAKVPGILPQKLVEHNGRAFVVMPKLNLEEPLTATHLEQVKVSLKAAHDAGYTFGDDIQAGIGEDGKAYVFDTGATRKLGKGYDRTEDVRDDESRLARLYEKAGVPFKGVNPSLDYDEIAQSVEKDVLSGKPISAAKSAIYRKKLERLFNNLDADEQDLLRDNHKEVLSRLAEKQPLATHVADAVPQTPKSAHYAKDAAGHEHKGSGEGGGQFTGSGGASAPAKASPATPSAPAVPTEVGTSHVHKAANLIAAFGHALKGAPKKIQDKAEHGYVQARATVEASLEHVLKKAVPADATEETKNAVLTVVLSTIQESVLGSALSDAPQATPTNWSHDLAARMGPFIVVRAAFSLCAKFKTALCARIARALP